MEVNMKKVVVAWKYGWPVGLFMFVVLEIVPMVRARAFDPWSFAIGLVLWSLGALWCGHVVDRVKNQRG